MANLTALMANLNRDAKKVKTPFKLSDFCFFAEAESREEPDAAPAAAYMQLVADGLMPGWALSVFPQMRPMAAGVEPPNPLAAIGEHFVLLAPEPRNGGMEGLLLATSEASGQELTVRVPGVKESIRVAVPEFSDAFIARENIFIPIL